MFVLVSYDIGGTDTRKGAKRLREVAKICLNYGQRVQYSVFEMDISPTHFTQMKLALLETIDQTQDSLRIYRLSERVRGEHYGIKPSLDLTGPLIF